MPLIPLFIILGLVAGTLSGLIGIGGGIVVIPALVYLAGFEQHKAQGTTLAMMIPPIGIMAAWAYYKTGNVDIKAAGLLCIGFVIGGWIGAKYAVTIPTEVLKRVFGVALMAISIKTIFF